MKRKRSEPRLPRDSVTRAAAIGALMLMAGMAFAGPSGLLAWGENLRLLEQRKAEVRDLAAQRDELRNRTALLDPSHVDADLAGELLRSNLNVVHPDEVVMMLPRQN